MPPHRSVAPAVISRPMRHVAEPPGSFPLVRTVTLLSPIVQASRHDRRASAWTSARREPKPPRHLAQVGGYARCSTTRREIAQGMVFGRARRRLRRPSVTVFSGPGRPADAARLRPGPSSRRRRRTSHKPMASCRGARGHHSNEDWVADSDLMMDVVVAVMVMVVDDVVVVMDHRERRSDRRGHQHDDGDDGGERAEQILERHGVPQRLMRGGSTPARHAISMSKAGRRGCCVAISAPVARTPQRRCRLSGRSS